MPRKSVRKSVKRQRSRSRSGRNSIRRKSSARRKRKSLKPSRGGNGPSGSEPPRRRSRARSRARKSVSRRSSTRRASTRRKRRTSVAPPPAQTYTAPAPSAAPRKSSVKRRRRRKSNTGAILTFYCIDCQSDKNVSNLRKLEYTHVAADTNRIKILATCGKCKGEVSRIVSPQQFQQLRKKKRIYEVLDGRPDEQPPLKAESPADLYSFPSAPRGAPLDDGEGLSGSGSESESDDGDGGGNPQADAIQSQSGSQAPPTQPPVDSDISLKRMQQPPDLKELGTSSYNFSCV